ncbi:IPT/TIG domain-containing protein [Dictyostelium discoideum AX4]|uniref:IPT/TIG domain-containing protein n=1 Tax=Dictyostelium discoideum TaxID=44689 RepID=Q54PB5_DICDI|nr:IPT/TIG domain-containing protein [Dictyostelium discoideum AX4]EAL65099.1 IPT/TIG domain-containing protein [Dictyostelium discoideum AX4]|eukprot:XP_638460.1 IPT/TIG domain-containing protein [Dictyostelium discoideum AX4]
MKFKIIYILIFFSLFFIKINSQLPPNPTAVKFEVSKLLYIFNKTDSYFTKLVLYDYFYPRYEMAPNYFNCTISRNDDRVCIFHSDEPFSRLWGSLYSRVYFREVSSDNEYSTQLIQTKFPAPYDVSFSRYPPTSGGDIVINGTFLRLVGGPSRLLHSIENVEPFVVMGNFSDQSFNCNSIKVTIPPGSGNFNFYFDDERIYNVPFSYAPPIISSTINEFSRSIIVINGDNFFHDTSLIKIYFDNIPQPNPKITVNHTQIEASCYHITDPGPLSIHIKVNGVSSEKNSSVCIPAIVKSITSVSSKIGGVVTIEGSKLFSVSKPNLIPIIEIGGKSCVYLQSIENTLVCKLNPDKSGGKNLPIIVKFDGCNSIISNDVTFSYDIPTIINAKVSKGMVIVEGHNLASLKENSIIEVNSQFGDIKIEIKQFQVSPDESNLSFKLPLLKCKNFNVNITIDGTPSILPVQAPIMSSVIKRPSSVNGTLILELYNTKCIFFELMKIPKITYGNTPSMDCSVPSLQTSNSDFYITSCPAPYGTGIDKNYTLHFNSESFENKYSYAPPVIQYRTFSKGQEDLTVHGSNFGNSLSLIKVFFNGSDISSQIRSLNNNQFSFKKLTTYENGMINITVDSIDMESPFYITLPPIIFSINNNISCNGVITINGKNLLTKDKEFQVKVLANEQTTTKIYSSEKSLYVQINSKRSPINTTAYIGEYLIMSKNIEFYKKKSIFDFYFDITKDNC